MLSLVGHNYWYVIIAKSFSQDYGSELNPSDSQLHVGASLQFTLLIFYRFQVRGLGQPWQKLHFVFSDPFFVEFDVCFGLIS